MTASARSIPVLHVGRDFCDLRYLGDGNVAATTGDVSGKGVAPGAIRQRLLGVANRKPGGRIDDVALAAPHLDA